MNGRVYSHLASGEAAYCFGDQSHQIPLVDLSNYHTFGSGDAVELLRRFQVASRNNRRYGLYQSDTCSVLKGLGRLAYVLPIHYWEQPKPVYLHGSRDEDFEVTPRCWEGQFDTVRLWAPCSFQNPVEGGLVGHLLVAITAPIDFVTFRNIMRSVTERGSYGLLRSFTTGELCAEEEVEVAKIMEASLRT